MKPNFQTRGPPAAILRRLYEHQRYLLSGGANGVRMGSKSYAPLRFSGLNLDYVDMSLAFLASAEFEECTLRHAWFLGAELTFARFSRCNLEGVCFDRAEMTATDLVTSDVARASFQSVSGEVLRTAAQSRNYDARTRKRAKALHEQYTKMSPAEREVHDRRLALAASEAEKQFVPRIRATFAVWAQRKAAFHASIMLRK